MLTLLSEDLQGSANIKCVVLKVQKFTERLRKSSTLETIPKTMIWSISILVNVNSKRSIYSADVFMHEWMFQSLMFNNVIYFCPTCTLQSNPMVEAAFGILYQS